ncbi:hypothetical protein OIV83_004704 [Microbotryomycetes sp. JL201]|nr:hypothetical protein OIV83_004704 [Microbotryomycetes sp. JL201]
MLDAQDTVCDSRKRGRPIASKAASLSPPRRPIASKAASLSPPSSQTPQTLERGIPRDSRPPDLATRQRSLLPTEILSIIFDYAAGAELPHGGELVRWNSHEAIRDLALRQGFEMSHKLSSTDWDALFWDAADSFHPAAAAKFLRTAEARPDLAACVRDLVVTLDEEEEEDPHELPQQLERRHVRESEDLTRVVEICPNLERLQARTIHPKVSWRFIGAIRDKAKITTFIGGPRPVNSLHSWIDFTYDKPLPLVFEHILQFELDSAYGAGTRPLPELYMPRIRGCRIGCDLPHDVICAFAQVVKDTLTTFYLYQERLLPIVAMFDGLRHQMPVIKRLKYHLNPSVTELEQYFDKSEQPLFDRLFQLEHGYKQLEYLSVSATDISGHAFRNLPSCLRHLEIVVYSEFNRLEDTTHVLDHALSDPTVPFSLERLTIKDAEENWPERSVQFFTDMCAKRGIRFEFVPDDGDDSA